MINRPNMFAMIADLAKNGVLILQNAGVPVDGTAGTGVNAAGPGSLLIDRTNKVVYLNTGTLASPVWTPVVRSGNSFTVRVRATAAEINAGRTLIAAPGAGLALRLTDAIMIAIGGNAAGATTVDILATQAAGSVKLVAAAVAGLTRSAVLRAGAANSTVLADGASFVANDDNTAITTAVTGSALTTATHVDFILDFAID